MMTRHEEDKLRDLAQELREQHADNPEYLRLAQKLERAAESGDDLLAAEAACCLITHTLGAPPINPRRRFLCG